MVWHRNNIVLLFVALLSHFFFIAQTYSAEIGKAKGEMYQQGNPKNGTAYLQPGEACR